MKIHIRWIFLKSEFLFSALAGANIIFVVISNVIQNNLIMSLKITGMANVYPEAICIFKKGFSVFSGWLLDCFI